VITPEGLRQGPAADQPGRTSLRSELAANRPTADQGSADGVEPLETGPYVFISYARVDQKEAQRLSQELRLRGINTWLDSERLLGGQKWQPAIRRAIRESRFFLALLSSNSVNKRGYVQKELRQALEILQEFPDSDVYIIPVRLDRCEPSHDALSDLQWVDLFPSWEDGFGQLIRSIGMEPNQANGRVSNAGQAPASEQAPELQALRAQYERLLRRLENAWTLERDSRPYRTDEGKAILQTAESELLEIRAHDATEMAPALADALADLQRQLRAVQRHEEFLDGGVSFQEFWTLGDQALANAKEIAELLRR
jgi:F0F1-type ATP synthase membrane subunit b/b'